MSNYEYWVKREEENRKQNLKDIKDYDKEIERIYKRMLNEVDTQINAWYSKYAAEEGITMAEAKKRADRLDIEAYAAKAKKYVEEKDFSAQANTEMKLYNLTMKANRLQLLKANIGVELVSGGDELEKYYQDVLEGKSIAEIERLSGILGKSIVDNNKLAKSIVGASFHNATWSERIWMHQDLLRLGLDKIVSTSIIQGKNPRVFIPEVRKKFGVTASNAERLLRTEIRRVQTDTQMESYKRNGFNSYTFISLGTACGDCLKNNGLHFRINEMDIGLNAPPIHPNCLCATAPYLDTRDFDTWLDGIDEHGLTFEEWMDSQRNIKIDSPKSFRKSLEYIGAGKAGLDSKRTSIANKIPNSGDYCYLPVNTISDRDMAYLSAYFGHELSLFRSKTHDVLLHGTVDKTRAPTLSLDKELCSGKYKWVSHTHVVKADLVPSPEDRQTLKKLNQKKNRLISGIDGSYTDFTQNMFEDKYIK